MIPKTKCFKVLVMIVVVGLLLTACSGVRSLIGGSGRGAPDPTAGVGLGQAGEDQESGAEEEPGELTPVTLEPKSPCNLMDDDEFLFSIEYEKFSWFGPPKVEITSGGGLASSIYEYDKVTKTGTITANKNAPLHEVNLTIFWPECKDEPHEATTEFRPTVTGTCRDDQIEITFVEKWESPYLLIHCEGEKDVCGEDPCDVTLTLPFGYGDSENKFILLLDRNGNVTPYEKRIPFVGPGGSGIKVYKFLTSR
jgi:hypothetical protein